MKVIDTFHPILFIELDNKNLVDQGSSAKELVLLLEGLGYAIIHSESSNRIDSNFEFSNCHFDIIAEYNV